MATQNVGGQARSIVFSRLTGASNQSPVLTGTVTIRLPQVVREQIEDVHSSRPYFRSMSMPGQIAMTFVQTGSLAWLSGATVDDADLQVLFTDGSTFTATGVTMFGDATEIDQTAGTSNERTFAYVSGTFKRAA
jgi:hypothetical protein